MFILQTDQINPSIRIRAGLSSLHVLNTIIKIKTNSAQLLMNNSKPSLATVITLLP